MITELDLDEAIAKCQAEENPTNNTCIRLAAFLTIKDHFFGGEPQVIEIPRYSQKSETEGEKNFYFDSDSEFFQIANGKKQDSVYLLFGEILDTLQVINPKLYNSIMRKVRDL